MPISPLRRSIKQSTLSAKRFSVRCSHRSEPSSWEADGSYLIVEWALLEESCRARQRLERINEATSYTVLLLRIKGIRHRSLPHREFYDPASPRSPSLRYRLRPSGCDWKPDQGRPLAAPRP